MCLNRYDSEGLQLMLLTMLQREGEGNMVVGMVEGCCGEGTSDGGRVDMARKELWV